MASRNLHVVHRANGWVVRAEGEDVDILSTLTQREAVERARMIAQHESNVVVHNRDGRIQERISYHDDLVSEEFFLTDRIVVSANVMHGKPRIAGTRILVQTLLDLLASGKTEEEIVSDDYYPDLTVEDIRACVTFASQLIEASEFVASDDNTSRPLYSTQIFEASPDMGI